MFPQSRRRINSAHVISTIALFVALSGTGYAALSIPHGSVGTAQLRSSSVTAAKVHANAVTSKAVKDGSLLARDFKRGQLPAGRTGGSGPRGPQGDPGRAGAPGSARAFGTVAEDGSLLPGSHGLGSTRVSAGRYCVKPTAGSGIDMTTSTPIVTGNEFAPVVASVVRGSGFCPDSWLITTQWLQGASTVTLALDNASFAIAIP